MGAVTKSDPASATACSIQAGSRPGSMKEQALYLDVSVVKKFDTNRLRQKIVKEVLGKVPRPFERSSLPRATSGMLNRLRGVQPPAVSYILNKGPSRCTDLITTIAKRSLTKHVIAVQLAKKIPMAIQAELAKAGVTSLARSVVHHCTSILVEVTIVHVDLARLFSQRTGDACWKGLCPLVSCFTSLLKHFVDAEQSLSRKVEETVCSKVVGHLCKVLPDEICKSSQQEGLTVEVFAVKNPYSSTSFHK